MRKEGKEKKGKEGGKSNNMKEKRRKNYGRRRKHGGRRKRLLECFYVLCFWFLLNLSTMVGIPSCESLDIHKSEREMWMNCNKALCSPFMIFCTCCDFIAIHLWASIFKWVILNIFHVFLVCAPRYQLVLCDKSLIFFKN
jgi:hypothetical protein